MSRRAKPNASLRVSAERVRVDRQARFSPIKRLNAQALVRALDLFEIGDLSLAARLWEAIENRDFQCKSVIPKRKRVPSLLQWEVLQVEDSAEALRHKEALEYFYNNLTATEALDRNRVGGFALLRRQMMDAVGKGYAAHEILWKAGRDSKGRDAYTAEFVQVPLWFFEQRTGVLRYLPREGTMDGETLEEGAWLITAGDRLMEATSVAYFYKNLALKDWLILCEKFGFPWTHGATAARKGSPEWKDFTDALKGLANDSSIATDLDAKITLHSVGSQGQAPQAPLCEYMDRAIATLWRGGDLSTMSKGDGAVGANPQEEETARIEEDDASMLGEALNAQVDRMLARYLFGEDRLLAYVRIVPAAKIDVDRELRIWETGARHGVELGRADYRERFSLPTPSEGEALMHLPSSESAPWAPAAGNSLRGDAGWAQFLQAAELQLDAAVRSDIQPIIGRLRAIGAMADPQARQAALLELREALPGYLSTLVDSETAEAFDRIYASALANGIAAQTGGMDSEL